MKIFVDTSAFYALTDKDDQYHNRAKEYYDSIIEKFQLVITDYILIECWYLIGSRLERDAAIKFWDGLSAGIVKMVKVEIKDLRGGRKIIDKFSDQAFSLVDVTSFTVMEREKIEKAFTFDPHFKIYRFGEQSKRYFKIAPKIERYE